MHVSQSSIPYQKLFQIRSRRSLIGAILALQAVVVGWGWWGTMQFTRSSLLTKIRTQVIDENARAVTYLSNAVAAVVNTPLREGSKGWEDAKRIAQNLNRPGRANMAILATSGGVIIPRGEKGREAETPKLALGPGEIESTIVTLLPGRESAVLTDLRPGSVIVGEADWLGEASYIAVLENPELGAKFIASQSRSAVAHAERQFADTVFFYAGMAVLLVLAITGVGLTFIVNGYDSTLMRFNRMLEGEVERRTRQGLAIRNGLIFGLAKLADYRDTDTGRHLERICRYCEMLAAQLASRHAEIDRAWIDRLKLASSMHDIGKVGIPDHILLKAGPLDTDERAQMEMHATIGADTLIAIRQHVGDDELLNMSVQVALCHHEKFDGTGYPSRLSGEEIPLAARIVALADVYDALTSKRVYKPPMSHDRAVAIISEGRGRHFDPVVVDAFLAVHAEFDQARISLQAADDDAERPLLESALARARSTHSLRISRAA